MTKILVPTDFSTCANNAVNFAVQSAKIFPVKITLLHAFEVNGNIYTDYMGVNKQFNQSLLDEVHNKLTQLKNLIEETDGIIVDTHVSVTPVIDAVVQATEDLKIDLVIMGTLGAGGLKEKLWSSKTSSLIGKTKVPVLVIPFYYEWKKPEIILLSTNHFEKEPAILNYIFGMGDLFMAKVQVAVFTDEDNDLAETFLEHARKIPQYEKKLQDEFKNESLFVTRLFGKEFEETLQKHIVENKIDLLAMVTYQKSFLDRIFHPSITKRMSYHTTVPLLAIPAER